MTPCAHYRQWSDGIQWVPLYVFILQGHSSSGTGTSQAENMVEKNMTSVNIGVLIMKNYDFKLTFASIRIAISYLVDISGAWQTTTCSIDAWMPRSASFASSTRR